jgi:MFS family permease
VGAAVVTAEGALPGAGSTQGAGALLLFNALTFVVVMLTVLTTPDAPAPPEMRGAWRHPAVIWTRTREAFGWVRTHRGPRAVFLAVVVFAMLATPLMQLLPLLVSEVYRAKEDTYGVLLAVMGVGAVAGGLGMKLVPRWYPMHHFIPLSITLGGALILALSLAETTTWAICFMFFVGVFWMWGFNSTAAAMQNLVSDQMRGRVSAVVNTIALGAMPLGTYLASRAGHAGEALLRRLAPAAVDSGTGTQLGLAATSLVLAAAGVVMLIWRTPEVDGLRPGDPGYDRRPGLWRGISGSAHRPSP